MPRPTEREIVLVRAYLAAGTWKGAACELGRSPVTIRHQAERAFARHGARNVAELVLFFADDLRDDTDVPLVESRGQVEDWTP